MTDLTLIESDYEAYIISLRETHVSSTFFSLQCNGYSAGGVVGSEPAALSAPVKAGDSVALNWTTWPDSHVVCILSSHLARLLFTNAN